MAKWMKIEEVQDDGTVKISFEGVDGGNVFGADTEVIVSNNSFEVSHGGLSWMGKDKDNTFSQVLEELSNILRKKANYEELLEDGWVSDYTIIEDMKSEAEKCREVIGCLGVV